METNLTAEQITKMQRKQYPLLRFLPAMIIYRLVRYLNVRSKIKQAEKLHSNNKVRYYVLSINNRLWCLNDFQIKESIKQGILCEKMRNVRHKLKHAIYYTK